MFVDRNPTRIGEQHIIHFCNVWCILTALSQLNRWLTYDTRSKQFSISDFAHKLETTLSAYSLDSRSQTLAIEQEDDTQNVGCQDMNSLYSNPSLVFQSGAFVNRR